MGDLLAEGFGGITNVVRNDILIEKQENGGEEQYGAEGIGVNLAFTSEIVSNEISWSIEESDQGTRKVGLKSGDMGDKCLADVAGCNSLNFG